MNNDEYADDLNQAYGNGNRLLSREAYLPFLTDDYYKNTVQGQVLGDFLEEHGDARHKLVRDRARNEHGGLNLNYTMGRGIHIPLENGEGNLIITSIWNHKTGLDKHYSIEWGIPEFRSHYKDHTPNNTVYIGASDMQPDEAHEWADQLPQDLSEKVHKALKDVFHGHH